VHQYQSNGFRRNAFLDRDDTYGRDELSTRGKLRWSPSDRVTVDVTGLYVDVDNGYDAWTIDNGFTTQSDRPGRDAQRSVAGSVRVAAELERFDLVSISGLAETDAVYSFDADWGNAAFWSPFVYDYVTRNDRERDTFNQEVRLLSKEDALAGRGQWLLGVYMLDLEESNDSSSMGVYDDGVFCDPCTLDQRVTSGYDARNVALFGQLDFPLGERAELTAGLRWERRSADYADTSGNRFDPDDRMVGGELGIAWQLSGPLRPYLRVARGYKAGGFNVAFAGVDFDDVETVAPEQIEFDAESLWSFEAGARGRWLDGRITADVNAFLVRRDDQQIRIPLQLFPGDPSSFLFLTENADRSEHSGIEADVEWQAQDRLRLFASLGLLSTEIERFAFFPELEGREQAHAPDYTYTLGAEYRGPAGWWGRFDVNGADAFYFDYSHGQKSKRYTVGNLRVGREWGPWGVTLWARNLFDEEYFVRGFFFGNEPPDFADRLYTRLGDPRHYGITLNYRL
jgi:outer membrane receptor protein involved in Fe transport